MSNYFKYSLKTQIFFKIKEFEEKQLHKKRNIFGAKLSSPRGLEESYKNFEVNGCKVSPKDVRIAVQNLLDDGSIILDDNLNLVIKKYDDFKIGTLVKVKSTLMFRHLIEYDTNDLNRQTFFVFPDKEKDVCENDKLIIVDKLYNTNINNLIFKPSQQYIECLTNSFVVARQQSGIRNTGLKIRMNDSNLTKEFIVSQAQKYVLETMEDWLTVPAYIALCVTNKNLILIDKRLVEEIE